MVLSALLFALSGQAQQQPLSFYRYIPDIKPASEPPNSTTLVGWGCCYGKIWKIAAGEEHLTIPNVSFYGRQAPKFPRSWIEKIRLMSHEKTHKYNFVGRILKPRKWVQDFAKEHFDADDWLEFQLANLSIYKPLGPFDRTGLEHHREVARAGNKRERLMDETYFQLMASSNFTLCPRGDHPFAMRFVEAIAAGSIPIIRSEEEDLDSPFWMLTSVPYRYYTLKDGPPFEYRQDWVDKNTQLFIKYQTFIEGDNTPQGWRPPLGMTEAIDRKEGMWRSLEAGRVAV